MLLSTSEQSISMLGIITYPSMRLYLQNSYTYPFGKYEYLKVLFGLAKAPVYFQELMDKVLKDIPFAIAYLYDIIIYSETAKEHLDALQQFFHKLCNAELTMKLSKCHFFVEEIKYLGPVLSTTGIKSTTFQNSSY